MASSSAPTVPEAKVPQEKPAEVVRGVPVGAYYAYNQQHAQDNRPVGYGSYSTQGVAPTYPYPQAEPTSFEVHESQAQQPLPCLCGYQLILCALLLPLKIALNVLRPDPATHTG